MPSSTSSSERCPAVRWAWVAPMAMLGSGLCFLGAEYALRSAGHRAAVQDDRALWASVRHEVSNGKAETLALLGASRVHLGFDLKTLRAELVGWTVKMLAVDGAHPLATLEDLGRDPSFRGVAVVGVSMPSFLPKYWDGQADYIRFYREEAHWGSRINRWLVTELQSRFAVMTVSARRLLMQAFHGRLPRVPYLWMDRDRDRKADYEAVDAERIRQRREGRLPPDAKPFDPTPWLSTMPRARAAVEAVQGHGGQVVFLRMPTDGHYRAHQERRFPRAQFFDRLAEQTGALTVHFADHPGLSGFRNPDASHLDHRDAPAFSRAFVRVLASKLDRL